MKKKYIFFDLDGTLTDSSEGIIKGISQAISRFGIKAESIDDLNKFIGPPIGYSFRTFLNFSDEQTEKATVYYREYYKDKGVFENKLYSGIDSLLESLKSQGKKIILATSKPRIFAVKVLEHFDIYKYFDFVTGSEFDGTRSEKAEVIKYDIESCGIQDLSEIIMVGDRKYDIIGAKKCGIDSVGVLYGFGSIQELKEAGADFIVSDVDELKKLLSSF